MLRIQVRESSDECTFIAEGEIEGPSATELEWCWRDLACRQNKTVLVDFTGVLRVDREGRRVLKSIYGSGVRFMQARLAVQNILDEICSSALSIDNKSSGIKSGSGTG